MGERAVICVLVLAMMQLSPASVRGVEHGVTFSGDLVYAYPAYGIDVPVDSGVIARLVYDSATAANYNLGACDCATYRQQIYNGFSVSFGPLIVRADEYDLHVINNFGPDGGSDFLRIVFSSSQSPPFDTPLVVNGQPQAAGQLVLSLRDPTGTAIDGSTLPDPAALGGFPLREALLKESPAQASYNMAAMLNLPEPLALAVGDFDFDADVDGADFLVWQREIGGRPSVARRHGPQRTCRRRGSRNVAGSLRRRSQRPVDGACHRGTVGRRGDAAVIRLGNDRSPCTRRISAEVTCCSASAGAALRWSSCWW